VEPKVQDQIAISHAATPPAAVTAMPAQPVVPPPAPQPEAPAQAAPVAQQFLQLPSGVVGRGDIARIRRELNTFSDQVVGAVYRGQDITKLMQQSSPLLISLATLNRYNLLDEKHRQDLYDKLDNLQKNAPAIHISFTTEPSAKALERVITWLRANIHPNVLLQVGLTPNIAAGCILRTPNKVFDMSLKETLAKQVPLLLKLIQGSIHGR
jgi:F0F1-type ATP synthase delta subunit